MAHLIPICPYCDSPSVLTNGAEVYPDYPDLYDDPIFICRPCQAWVGCHPGTKRALGRLANAELRKRKREAHEAFDPFWKRPGGMTRTEAYRRLSRDMGIPPEETHIGMMDEVRCQQVVAICSIWTADLMRRQMLKAGIRLWKRT